MKKKIIKKSDIAQQYRSASSFADLLPWQEWSDEQQVMLLEDGHSVGQVLEIRDIPTEAQPEAVIQILHRKVTDLFSTVVPLEDDNPWVIQFFIQDDLTLDPLYHKLENYIAEKNNLADPFAQEYLAVMKHHFKTLCREDGLFVDPLSGSVFRGRTRRIRLVVYRRYTELPNNFDTDVVAEVKAAVDNLVSRLRQVGLSVRLLKGKHLYEWWVRWFNPKPALTNGDCDQLLKQYPYPESNKSFGWNFSQNCFFDSIQDENDSWEFDGIKHKILVFKDLQNPIDIGVISRERSFGSGKNKYALLDQFPPGSIYTIQVVFESKNSVKKHLTTLEKAAVGKGLLVKEILKNIERATDQMDENNNMLFRTQEAIYYRGTTNEELNRIEQELKTLLHDSGLLVLDPQEELFPLDTYLRFLPFNFNYHFDKKNTYRSTYKYADDVVRLLPLYGRSRGDGVHPLFIFYNRGGEAFMFDHLNKYFKMSNSHMAIIGTTGAGKSVTLNNLCMVLSAVYRPHIVVLEVGGSFDLTAKYFAAHGRNVSSQKFQLSSPISVNPYSEAYRALDKLEQDEALIELNTIQDGKKISPEGITEEVLLAHVEEMQVDINNQQKLATEAELVCEEERDILNEIVLATRIMITRGLAREEANINLTDMTLIHRALIHALKRCRKNNVPQVLVQHVGESFSLLAKDESNPELQKRLTEFAMRLEYYYTDHIRSSFINKESKPLGEFDFLHIDFGFMQSESYEDLMNIVCLSILSKILAMAEKNKATNRPTILIMDEAHVLFKSEMVATFVTLMAKVARKIGLWLIPCTQNINDFKSMESRKVLSMMETWLCLALDKEEVKLLEQFKPLTDEMRNLVMDIQKYPGVYAEGVLLGKRYCGLFRNVPPRLSLSLAMTEQEERAERVKIQQEHNLTELEAVQHMATRLEKVSHQKTEDVDFYD